ncbi:hypothetical protein CA13_65660 [Planctomycetes bacterium CA13]|uniref:Uncharacterized protein n=1 Tax=Novipirellula herctigrandis TaxID=2527986 RepID=A0A5C5ZCM8_9BACT|nr:hypothetical protein CA13_65660 [Planctomycetes bacterium CA13]
MPKTTDNNAVHTEDGVALLQMENQLAVPGDGCRSLDEEITSRRNLRNES